MIFHSIDKKMNPHQDQIGVVNSFKNNERVAKMKRQAGRYMGKEERRGEALSEMST